MGPLHTQCVVSQTGASAVEWIGFIGPKWVAVGHECTISQDNECCAQSIRWFPETIQQQGYQSVPYPCYGRSLLLVQIVLILIMIMTMMFHVTILPLLLYATILPYITCYCLLSLYHDISHALFHCIMLAGVVVLFVYQF